jgi:glycosyltransferase involved in cell wall biosynthesis
MGTSKVPEREFRTAFDRRGAVWDATDGMTRGPNVSVVCPFYNESAIIEHSIRNLAANLERLDCDWELLVVNDGSTDDSDDIARRVAAEYPRVRVLGYSRNKGRGAALLTGINEARGAIIVTTEIDLSWGESIVHDLLAAMHACPEADIVVASPHLPGGGYRNVPVKRVLLSRFGNKGDPRVHVECRDDEYGDDARISPRRDHVPPMHEPGKEFHLEVILKATALGYRIHEIPAVLEWKDYKQAGERRKRKSSSRVNRLIVSHSLFSLLANPVRYVWALSFLVFLVGLLFFAAAVVQYLSKEVSAFSAIVALLLFIVAGSLFVVGIVLKQGNMIQRELWALQSRLQVKPRDARDSADDERSQSIVAGRR